MTVSINAFGMTMIGFLFYKIAIPDNGIILDYFVPEYRIMFYIAINIIAWHHIFTRDAETDVWLYCFFTYPVKVYLGS